MLKRIYPIFISMLGTVGLALALAYLAGAYLAFQPAWQKWAEFFVPRALPFLVVPYALLLGYLYLRSNLGMWLLRRGMPEEAIAYCEPRLSRNLLRSRAEALSHRVALARAHIYLGAYEAAREVLESGYKRPNKGRAALEIGRWLMEIALRQENLVRCHRAWDAVSTKSGPARLRSELHACRAELAVREGEREAFETALDRAKWKGAGLARVQWAEILGEMRFLSEEQPLLGKSDPPKPYTERLVVLERIEPEIVAEIPGRAAEFVAIRAKLLYRGGETSRARELLARVDPARCDARSNYEVAQVRALVQPESA